MYGGAIRKHRDSLEFLDLDMRHGSCNERGHASNPAASLGEKMRIHQTREQEEEWKNAHLIGSLRDFKALVTLAIDVSALCGGLGWSTAPYTLRESLPLSLKVLKLYTKVAVATGDVYRFEDQGNWQHQLVELITGTQTSLRYVGLMIRYPTSKRADRLGLRYDPLIKKVKENDVLFDVIKTACLSARVEFGMLQAQETGTVRVPWFEEVDEGRCPGRDN